MKQFLMMLTLLFLFNACSKEKEETMDCNELKTALIDEDDDLLNTEIDALVTDLTPNATSGDVIGHKENINILIDRLNECDQITTTLGCYACVETLPHQSEIIVTLMVSGNQIERIIDISTPKDNLLKSVGMH